MGKRKITCPRCGHDIFHITETRKAKDANIVKLKCTICERTLQFKTKEEIYF